MTITPITTGRIKLAEFSRNVHVAVAPKGVALKDALDPVFWANVAQQFKPKDRIELWAEDRAWFADLIVVAASRLSVEARVLNKLILDAQSDKEAVATSTGYHVDWGGSVDLHRVIRDADGAVMTLGLSRTEADQWIKDHLAAQAGKKPEASPSPFTPASETPATRAAVVIPDNWQALGWQERRSLASKLTDDPVHNGEEANAAIEAELARRAA
jgi:hypothetical protein